jgi:tryptophan-rich sensory protein
VSVEFSRNRRLLGLGGWLLASFSAGALGAVASRDADVFYEPRAGPARAPPAGRVGPGWSARYAVSGLAAGRVWKGRGVRAARLALGLFLVQLAANALWTWIVFAWRDGGLAFAEILVLWARIAATTVAFWRIRPLAGALMIPYLAWVTFAAALTCSVWRLNPQL